MLRIENNVSRLKRLLGDYVFHREIDGDEFYIYEIENLSNGNDYLYLLLEIYVVYEQIVKVKVLFTDVYYEYDGIDFKFKPYYQGKKVSSFVTNIRFKLNTYRVLKEILKVISETTISICTDCTLIPISKKLLKRWGYRLIDHEGNKFKDLLNLTYSHHYYVKTLDISLTDIYEYN